jgi:N-acetylmuramoyl-L-alanine amidase-like protein
MNAIFRRRDPGRCAPRFQVEWLGCALLATLAAGVAGAAAKEVPTPVQAIAARSSAAGLPESFTPMLAGKDPFAFADRALPRLADLGPAQRSQLAQRLAGWPVARRVAVWAFLQVGTPYRLGPLGEGAPPDSDPVIDFQSTDCAVLNLVSAALAHARDAGGEREAMALANYRGGAISYTTRFHFTTDRLDGSPYYRDITEQVGGRACRSREVVLNRRAEGGRWIPIDWSRPRRVPFVPRAWGPHFARWHDQKRLPAATGVAFVQIPTLSDGLDVVHESMLWRGRTLLHASSRTGRVVTMPWAEFLAGPGRRYDGFVLFEYR